MTGCVTDEKCQASRMIVDVLRKDVEAYQSPLDGKTWGMIEPDGGAAANYLNALGLNGRVPYGEAIAAIREARDHFRMLEAFFDGVTDFIYSNRDANPLLTDVVFSFDSPE